MRKMILSILLLLTLPIQAQALTQSAGDVISIRKYEKRGGTLHLTETYKKKWKDVSISSRNLRILNVMSTAFEAVSGYHLYLVGLTILQDNTVFAYLESMESAAGYRINFLTQEFCVENPSTGDYEHCRILDVA